MQAPSTLVVGPKLATNGWKPLNIPSSETSPRVFVTTKSTPKTSAPVSNKEGGQLRKPNDLTGHGKPVDVHEKRPLISNPAKNVSSPLTPKPADLPKKAKSSRGKQPAPMEIDLLAMALYAQKLESQRKSKAAATLPTTTAASLLSLPLKIGKVRGAGEIARRKNRLSTLKKKIVKERREGQVHRAGMQGHPALLGFNCVWLKSKSDCEDLLSDHEEDKGEEDEEDGLDHDVDQVEREEDDVVNTLLGPLSNDPKLHSPVYFGAYYSQHSKTETSQPSPLQVTKSPIRDYVHQALSKDLDQILWRMLEQLFKFQERARIDDPLKAKSRRRLVLGLREVFRGVRSKTCLAVIICRNMEELSPLDERVKAIVDLCEHNPNRLEFESEIPVWFTGLSRIKLGKCLGVHSPVSCVGVFRADGAHEEYRQALMLAKKLKAFYQQQVQSEINQALLGKLLCCAQCFKAIASEFKRDCLTCGKSYCTSCGDSCLFSGKVSCVEPNTSCSLVSISRSIPPLVPKKLSVAAKSFVPLGMNSVVEE